MSTSAFEPDWFSPPGDTIATLMARRHMTIPAAAAALGCDPMTVRGLLAGVVEVDMRIAKKLAEALGGSVDFWRRRQVTYEAALERAAGRLSPEETTTWLRHLPLKDMADYGWRETPARRASAIKRYLAYFGVTSPKEWERRYTSSINDIKFRSSPSFTSKAGPLSAWLRQSEIEAALVPCDKWDADVLRKRLPEIRALTNKRQPRSFIPQLREIFASAGVAVVFVRTPPGCSASGATKFLSDDKAMVALSFRYLSDDHFWFTVFHEIGHLLLHGKSATFVEGQDWTDVREQEANRFAANILIPIHSQEELADLPAKKEPVIRFAVRSGIAPGIVVGQMQHLGNARRDQLNFLKRRYDWNDIAAVA